MGVNEGLGYAQNVTCGGRRAPGKPDCIHSLPISIGTSFYPGTNASCHTGAGPNTRAHDATRASANAYTCAHSNASTFAVPVSGSNCNVDSYSDTNTHSHTNTCVHANSETDSNAGTNHAIFNNVNYRSRSHQGH